MSLSDAIVRLHTILATAGYASAEVDLVLSKEDIANARDEELAVAMVQEAMNPTESRSRDGMRRVASLLGVEIYVKTATP